MAVNSNISLAAVLFIGLFVLTSYQWKKYFGGISTVCFAIFIFLCLVIFGFSAQDGMQSGHLSDRVAGWIAVVIRVLFHQNISIEKLSFPVRKMAHMTEYALLWLDCFGMLLTGKYYRRTEQKKGCFTEKKLWLYSATIVLAVSVSDEIHQRFVPGRAGQMIDVGWDMLGVSICMILVRLLLHPLFQKIRSSSRWHSED